MYGLWTLVLSAIFASSNPHRQRSSPTQPSSLFHGDLRSLRDTHFRRCMNPCGPQPSCCSSLTQRQADSRHSLESSLTDLLDCLFSLPSVLHVDFTPVQISVSGVERMWHGPCVYEYVYQQHVCTSVITFWGPC